MSKCLKLAKERNQLYLTKTEGFNVNIKKTETSSLRSNTKQFNKSK